MMAIHINMLPTGPSPGMDGSELTEMDKAGLERVHWFKEGKPNGVGYQMIQGTRPQTLSYGLNDSPVGLLAWILEKIRDWSDCRGDIGSVYSKDEVLTNVMIYWLSGSIGSSVRLYALPHIHHPLRPFCVAALSHRCALPDPARCPQHNPCCRSSTCACAHADTTRTGWVRWRT